MIQCEHAYVLMDNHYHLLIETPEANASCALQWLNLSYAAWFNAKHGCSGPMFQARFKSISVDGEGSWALTCSVFIHLNPVRIQSLGQGKEDRAREKAGFMQEGPTVEQVKGEPWQDFADRRGDWGRDLALYVAHSCSGRTLAELGELSGMSIHGVSKAVQRMSVRLTKDKKLNRPHRKVMLALEEKG